MTPAVGQQWRARGTGNVYRVVALQLEAPNPYERVELELVEHGDIPHRDSHVGDRMTVEPAWFERGAATLRQPQLPGVA